MLSSRASAAGGSGNGRSVQNYLVGREEEGDFLADDDDEQEDEGVLYKDSSEQDEASFHEESVYNGGSSPHEEYEGRSHEKHQYNSPASSLEEQTDSPDKHSSPETAAAYRGGENNYGDYYQASSDDDSVSCEEVASDDEESSSSEDEYTTTSNNDGDSIMFHPQRHVLLAKPPPFASKRRAVAAPRQGVAKSPPFASKRAVGPRQVVKSPPFASKRAAVAPREVLVARPFASKRDVALDETTDSSSADQQMLYKNAGRHDDDAPNLLPLKTSGMDDDSVSISEDRKMDAVWMKQFGKLADFHETNGHFSVSRNNDKPFYVWVLTQKRRTDWSNNKEELSLLHGIGFTPGASSKDSQDDDAEHRRWLQQFEHLKAHQAKYGHLRVDPQTRTLHDWVKQQCSRMQWSSGFEYQLALLRSIGLPMDVDWQQQQLHEEAEKEEEYHVEQFTMSESEEERSVFSSDESFHEEDDEDYYSGDSRKQPSKKKVVAATSKRKAVAPANKKKAVAATSKKKVMAATSRRQVVEYESDSADSVSCGDDSDYKENGDLNIDHKDEKYQDLSSDDDDDDDDDLPMRSQEETKAPRTQLQGADDEPVEELSSAAWMKHFENLKEYYQKHGHFCVMWGEEDDDDDNEFCVWVWMQKTRMEWSKNMPWRAKLKSIGFVPGIAREKNFGRELANPFLRWMKNFEMLRDNKAKYGTLQINSKKSRNLYRWMLEQRRKMDWKGCEYQAALLRQLGVQLMTKERALTDPFMQKKAKAALTGTKVKSTPEDLEKVDSVWRKHFTRLKAYRKKFGQFCFILEWEDKDEEFYLWLWMQKTRTNWSKNKRELVLLRSIGFEPGMAQEKPGFGTKIRPSNLLWLKQFELLRNHQFTYGTLNVNSAKKEPLYRWMTNQKKRTDWQGNNFRPALCGEIGLLRKTGLRKPVAHPCNQLSSTTTKALANRTVDSVWMRNFQELKAYHKKYGNLCVLWGEDNDEAFCVWVWMQRTRLDWSNNEAELVLLKSIGFVPGISKARSGDGEFSRMPINCLRWLKTFEMAREYQAKYGTLDAHSVKQPTVYRWAKQQRVRTDWSGFEYRLSLLRNIGMFESEGSNTRITDELAVNSGMVEKMLRLNATDDIDPAWMDHFDKLKGYQKYKDWMWWFLRLKAFHDEHGHSHVPEEGYDDELYQWRLSQYKRTNWFRNGQGEVRLKLLKSIDLVPHHLLARANERKPTKKRKGAKTLKKKRSVKAKR